MDMILTEPKADDERLHQLAGKVATDVAAAMTVLLAYIGDETGVYRAMRRIGRAAPADIAAESRVDARYLLEWLSNQTAAGYVTYHADDGTFSLSPEQTIVFTEEGHPACAGGIFNVSVGQCATHEQAIETFRSGQGRFWAQHHSCLFCGTDRFFRAGYLTHLTSSWLPALDGMVERLERGAKVADIGCGHGSSTVLMAQAFPASVFHGMDFHAPSIEEAKAHAAEAGVTGNTRFTVDRAGEYTEDGYDLACLFDALHDMGDPVGAARNIRRKLKPDGMLMVVEPLAGDRLEENLHVLGQLFYASSTLICAPAARAQGPTVLGAQAGEKRLSEVLASAGFSRVRRVAQTDTNMVLEARP